MEARLCQEGKESISAGETECKPHVPKHGLPKSQAWGPALCACYVDSQGQDLETLTFWSEPGPVGLRGRPVTMTKMTATCSPIKPKRDVFVTPESIIKILDSSLPHQIVGLGRCDCKCQGFLGAILWCMLRASSHRTWWTSTCKIHCRGSNDTPTDCLPDYRLRATFAWIVFGLHKWTAPQHEESVRISDLTWWHLAWTWGTTHVHTKS